MLDICNRMACDDQGEQKVLLKDIVFSNEKAILNQLESVIIDEIVDTRLNEEHKRDYLIKFQSWVPEDHLRGLSNLLKQFWTNIDENEAQQDNTNEDDSKSNESLSPRLYISDTHSESYETIEEENNCKLNGDSHYDDYNGETISLEQNETENNKDFETLNSSDENVEKENICEVTDSLQNTKTNMMLTLKLNEQEDKLAKSPQANVASDSSITEKEKTNKTRSSIEDVLSPLNIQKPKKRKLKSLDDIVRKISNSTFQNSFQFHSQNQVKNSGSSVLCCTHKEDKENLIESCNTEHMENCNEKRQADDDFYGFKTEHVNEGEQRFSQSNETHKNVYWSGGKAFSKRHANYDAEMKKSSPKKSSQMCCKFCEIDFSSAIDFESHICSSKEQKPENISPIGAPKCHNNNSDNVPPPLMMLNQSALYSRRNENKNTEDEEMMEKFKDTRESQMKLPIRNLLTKMHHTSSDNSFMNNARISPEQYTSYNAQSALQAFGGRAFKNFKFNCPLCKKSLDDRDLLTKHIRAMHPEEHTVPCEICNSFFIDKKELENHLIRHHSKKCYMCEECKETFEDFLLYERHTCRHRAEKMFKCHICEQTFQQQLNWSRHMEYAHPDAEKFPCRICGKIYFDQLAFKIHLRRIHKMELLETDYKVTSKVVSEAMMYPYNSSSPQFNPKSRYGEHSPRSYHGKPKTTSIAPYPVRVDPVNVNHSLHADAILRPNSKQAIAMRVPDTSQMPYEADKMRLQATYLRRPPPLVSSSYSHPAERRFITPRYIGGKPEFEYRHQPNGHNRNDLIPKNSISENNSAFSNCKKPSLMNILPHHQSPSPAVNQVKNVKECDQCNENFTSQSLYEIHVQSHHKGSFQCNKCQRIFARKSLYDSHMKVHEPSKSHLCPYCQRSFSMKGNLRRHIRIHTNEAPYECPICFQRFRRSDGLKGHIRRHETMGETKPVDMLPSQAAATTSPSG